MFGKQNLEYTGFCESALTPGLTLTAQRFLISGEFSILKVGWNSKTQDIKYNCENSQEFETSYSRHLPARSMWLWCKVLLGSFRVASVSKILSQRHPKKWFWSSSGHAISWQGKRVLHGYKLVTPHLTSNYEPGLELTGIPRNILHSFWTFGQRKFIEITAFIHLLIMITIHASTLNSC